uniref:Uncharacterized protein n=1 Tax=Timema genevievae TaxID=629358 RepID=A0A7R9K595_TIMGE|nr:unnamed protein product [Timema genevievae]
MASLVLTDSSQLTSDSQHLAPRPVKVWQKGARNSGMAALIVKYMSSFLFVFSKENLQPRKKVMSRPSSEKENTCLYRILVARVYVLIQLCADLQLHLWIGLDQCHDSAQTITAFTVCTVTVF